MDIQNPFWARREIATLDPVRDCRRIAHLLLEVRYGEPRFIHPMFALAYNRSPSVDQVGPAATS